MTSKHLTTSSKTGSRRFGIFSRIFAIIFFLLFFIITFFVALTIPKHQENILKSLVTQAKSISSSISQICSIAIIKGEYSFIVTHNMEVVEKNPDILYVIVVRNNGFVLIHTKEEWTQSDAPDPEWLTDYDLDYKGRIYFNPLVDREVFHYSYPLESSGIEWGWLHIGLSIDSYKKQVKTMYMTIGILALFSLAFGAIGAFLFAQQITRPILMLRNTTMEIMNGDLSARSTVSINNEIGDLSFSFNEMSDKLQYTIDEIEKAHKELQSSQKQLVESEKMASLGQLVAGIAHEINTPVGIGVTASSHLKKTTSKIKSLLEKNEMTRSALEEYFEEATEISNIILQHLNRTSDLVKSFKQVSADQTSRDKRKFDVKEYLGDIILSLRPKLKRTSIVTQINCPDSIILDSYPGAFAQIITNLIINSLIHGYDDGENGIISIDVTNTGDQVQIILRDNGKGIPRENLGKIFDPFYTTKRGSGGTGLGLHIVYNLVSQSMKGTITCESVEGEGAGFIIKLPITD